MVLPELQHIRRDALLGQLQAGGGAVHQDPGGGAGGRRGEGGGREGEALQAAPPGSQPGSGPRGGGQGDQTQHGHTGSH